MMKLQGHNGKVSAVAFSPDGRRLASLAPREKRASLWELPTGKRTFSPGGDEEIQALAFAPDGCSIALASGRYLHRWDLNGGTITKRWFRGANYCWQAAYSPDGSLVATTCFNRRGEADCYRVDLFRPAHAGGKKKFLVGGYGWPKCMAFSPTGRFLAVGGDDKRVRVWDLKGETKGVSFECAGNVLALAFSADETLIAVSAGKKLTVYDVPTRKPCGDLAGHTGYVCALTSSPGGVLLSAADDGTVRIWDLSTRRERTCFDWKIGRLNTAAFSPDGTLAAVGGEEGIVVWDMD